MYVVQPARSDDAAGICVLMAQLGYHVAETVLRRRLERRNVPREVFIARGDDRTLGWVAVAIHETLVEGRGAELEGLVVDEGVRGRGIGKQLLDAAENWAIERGCDEMRVRSNVLRERAHGFYRRSGYETIKAQYNFRKRLRLPAR